MERSGERKKQQGGKQADVHDWSLKRLPGVNLWLAAEIGFNGENKRGGMNPRIGRSFAPLEPWIRSDVTTGSRRPSLESN
jgi:hypothetical protein